MSELDRARVIALRAQRDAWSRGERLPPVPQALAAPGPMPDGFRDRSWLWYWLATLAVEADVEVAAARRLAAGRDDQESTLRLSSARNLVASRWQFDDYPGLIFASIGSNQERWRRCVESLGTPEWVARPASLAERPARRGQLARLLGFLGECGFELGEPELRVCAAAPSARSFVISPLEMCVVLPAEPRTDSDWRAVCHELGHVWRAHSFAGQDSARWPSWEAPTRAHEEAAAEWVADLADGGGFGLEVLGLDPSLARARSRSRSQAAVRRRSRTAYRAVAELALYRESSEPQPAVVDRLWVLDPGVQLVYAAAEAERQSMVAVHGSAVEAEPSLVRALADTLPRAGAAGSDGWS